MSKIPKASNLECIQGDNGACVMQIHDTHTCKVGLEYWARVSDISVYEMEYWVQQVTPNAITFQVGHAMVPLHIAERATEKAQEALWE